MLARSYAHALNQLLSTLPAYEGDRIIRSFLGVLARRGHRALLPRIVRELSRIHTSGSSNKPVVLVPRGSERETLQSRIDAICSQLAIEPTTLAWQEDDRVVGGFLIRTKHAQYDATYRRALITLYQKLAS